MPQLDREARADLAHCRAAIRAGSKSFHAASLILPREVRDGAIALYAFCRLSDDLIDLGAGDAAAVAELSARLERAYAGDPAPRAADRAFARAVRHFDIPKVLPAALIEGLAWDAVGRRYETLDELYDYAARVAGSVGAMMAALMGARARDAVARACDLGVAMQLTNIARDIGEDARAGRVYLPLSWLRESDIDVDEFLAAPRCTPALADVTARLLEVARAFYDRGLAGVDFLPVACRPGIVAAAEIYADIGAEIARNGYDSVTQRAFVPARTKLARLLGAVTGLNFACRSAMGAPLPANAFLVEAVGATPHVVRPRAGGEKIVDLFLKLERRDRASVGVAPA